MAANLIIMFLLACPSGQHSLTIDNIPKEEVGKALTLIGQALVEAPPEKKCEVLGRKIFEQTPELKDVTLKFK